MSLFGSLMREMERDPIFGAHQRAMNRMMNSFFGAPMGGPGFGLSLMGPPNPMGHHEEQDDLMPFGGAAMSPFGAFGGFPNMSQMMNMDPGNGGHAFVSSNFVSISSGPDGRPQVYQASSELRQGPDGLKETRKTLADSRSGTKKMAVGRHLGEKSHIVEREQNLRTGQLNENHEFYNLEEEEAPVFDREWRQRAQGHRGGYSHSSSLPAIASGSATSLSSGTGSSRSSSYVEPVVVEEEPEIIEEYNNTGYRPRQSSSSVTIEELPASDDEIEQLQQQSRSSRRGHATSSSAAPAAAASSSSSFRRSPYETSKEKRQRRSKLGKNSRFTHTQRPISIRRWGQSVQTLYETLKTRLFHPLIKLVIRK